MKTTLDQCAYSPEDYLALEQVSEERHAYLDEKIQTLTWGTPNHNEIGGNLYVLLKLALKGQGYRIFYADQRL